MKQKTVREKIALILLDYRAKIIKGEKYNLNDYIEQLNTVRLTSPSVKG